MRETHDFIADGYSLDGGAMFSRIANFGGFGDASTALRDDFASTIFSEGKANGKAFRLRTALENRANDEDIQFHDIELTGSLVTSIPLRAGAAGTMVRHRRPLGGGSPVGG